MCEDKMLTAHARRSALNQVRAKLPNDAVLLDLQLLAHRNPLVEYARMRDIDVEDAVFELLGLSLTGRWDQDVQEALSHARFVAQRHADARSTATTGNQEGTIAT
jgi:hypothetical protein